MAALTDAMKWYSLGGLKTARLKYLFKVEFYSSKYITLPVSYTHLRAHETG
jgi:hypothetical protein